MERDSLSFSDITNIFKGETIVKVKANVFFKSLKDLDFKIKDRNLSLKFNPDKKLVDNNYLPPHITIPGLKKINKIPGLIRFFKNMNK